VLTGDDVILKEMDKEKMKIWTSQEDQKDISIELPDFDLASNQAFIEEVTTPVIAAFL